MDKPILTSALICEAATIDQQNRAILYGVFSQINTKSLPATHPQFSVFCVWEGKAGEKHQQMIKIVSPENKIVAQTPEMNFEIGMPQARLISQFNLMRFEQFGNYKIQILLDGEVIREINLEVVNLGQPKKES